MTEQPTEPVFRRGAPTVQSDLANFDLVLTWYDFFAEPHAPQVTVRVPVEQIPDLLNMVVNQGTVAMREAAQALALGECATCFNTRLVERPITNVNRTERVHCPDCHRSDAGFVDAPTVGPKVKEG